MKTSFNGITKSLYVVLLLILYYTFITLKSVLVKDSVNSSGDNYISEIVYKNKRWGNS
jgi:hypothetical protein